MKKPLKGATSYKTDAEKVRERLAETKGDTRWWKVQPGEHIVRILPPWGKTAEGMFFFTAGLHYNFSVGGENKAVPCLKTAVPPQRCTICEFVQVLKNADDKKLAKLANRIRQKRKYWVNLIDRAHPDEVKMYGGSRKFIEKIEEALNDDDIGDPTDPVTGHDVKVKRVGSGFTDTRYTFSVRPKPTPIGVADWKSKLHKLDEVVIEWMSAQEVNHALHANFEEEMAEVGYKVKLEKKKTKVKDEEEDDEEDESEDKKDEDEEDEDSDEEEDEEEDDEDEEEDE